MPYDKHLWGGNLEPKIMEIKVKSANAKGYETATENDSINLSFLESKTRRGRVGKGVAQTLDCGCKQGVLEPLERFYKQAFETAQENDCQDGNIIDAYNKRVSKDGITPTATTRPEGFKTAILPMQNYRIRKLTSKECFRLMGVKDEDYVKVAKNQSNSSLYHLAGDSIVVNVLMALFNQML